MPCRRGPPRLVDDDRLGPPPGAHQAVKVLMMMKRIAATPVHEPDVGIEEIPTVILKRLFGIEQHVGDSRDRNVTSDRVLTNWQRWNRRARPHIGEALHAAVAESKTTARQTDLPEHRGERDHHP